MRKIFELKRHRKAACANMKSDQLSGHETVQHVFPANFATGLGTESRGVVEDHFGHRSGPPTCQAGDHSGKQTNFGHDLTLLNLERQQELLEILTTTQCTHEWDRHRWRFWTLQRCRSGVPTGQRAQECSVTDDQVAAARSDLLS